MQDRKGGFALDPEEAKAVIAFREGQILNQAQADTLLGFVCLKIEQFGIDFNELIETAKSVLGK